MKALRAFAVECSEAARLAVDGRALPAGCELCHKIAAAAAKISKGELVDGKIIAAKTQAGEADLQARNIGFSDITILKRGEKLGRFETYLWPISKGSQTEIQKHLGECAGHEDQLMCHRDESAHTSCAAGQR